MRFDVVTLFPEMFAALANFGISRRALEDGRWVLNTWNPRDFTDNNYRTVDDRPYGGGPGMVMLPEPLEKAIAAAKESQRQNGGGSGTFVRQQQEHGSRGAFLPGQLRQGSLQNALVSHSQALGRHGGTPRR